VARALAQEPAVLLLDEVTAHLDLKYQGAILGLVRRMAGDGLIVLAALHDLNLAALYADRLALLREGRLLVCGPPAAVLTPRWLRLAYEVHARVVPHPAHGTPVVSLVLDDGAKEAICDRVW
jgi:iron complex transport system ATP-binding protein